MAKTITTRVKNYENDELNAIATCCAVLEPLPADGGRRVIDWVVSKYLGAEYVEALDRVRADKEQR